MSTLQDKRNALAAGVQSSAHVTFGAPDVGGGSATPGAGSRAAPRVSLG